MSYLLLAMLLCLGIAGTPGIPPIIQVPAGIFGFLLAGYFILVIILGFFK